MITKFDYFNGICPFCLEQYTNNDIVNINESLSDKITSLQIFVPTTCCVNDCKSCIAKISNQHKFNTIKDNIDNVYLYNMQKVSNMGCRNAVFTGNGEPIQNKKFLKKIDNLNKKLTNPFTLEIQTTGVMLNDKNLKFLEDIGVKIISLSVFDIFDNDNNLSIMRVKNKLLFDLVELVNKIKNYNFILRISINLINVYDNRINDLFNKIKKLSPDQLTFRVMWSNNVKHQINTWIKRNKCSNHTISSILKFLSDYKIGKNLFDFNGISIYMNENCMKDNCLSDDGGYLILRSDGELYNKWSDKTPISNNRNVLDIPDLILSDNYSF